MEQSSSRSPVHPRHQTQPEHQHHHQRHRHEEEPTFTFNPVLASTLFEQEQTRHRDLHASRKTSDRAKIVQTRSARPRSSDGEDEIRSWRSGIKDLDAEMGGIWRSGSVLGIADVEGNGMEGGEDEDEIRNSHALISNLVATHLFDLHHDDEQKSGNHPNDDVSGEQSAVSLPSVYILTQPRTVSSLMTSIHNNLTRKLEQHSTSTSTKSTSSVAFPSVSERALHLLSNLSLMQYLDLTGLSESTSEISSSLKSRSCSTLSTTTTRRQGGQHLHQRPTSRKVLVVLSGLPEVLNNSLINRANLSQTAASLTLILRDLRDIVNVKTLIRSSQSRDGSVPSLQRENMEINAEELAPRHQLNEGGSGDRENEDGILVEHIEVMAIMSLLTTFAPSTSMSTSTFSSTNINTPIDINTGSETTLPFNSPSTTTPSRTTSTQNAYQPTHAVENNNVTTEDIPSAFADHLGRALRLCTSPYIPSSSLLLSSSYSSAMGIAKIHETTLMKIVDNAIDTLVLVRWFDDSLFQGVSRDIVTAAVGDGGEKESGGTAIQNETDINIIAGKHTIPSRTTQENKRGQLPREKTGGGDVVVEIVKDRGGSLLGEWCIWS